MGMATYGATQLTVPAGARPAALFKRGPGDLPGSDVHSVLIFNAGASGLHGDAIGEFYRKDVAGLDWLEDYLRHPPTSAIVRDLVDPPEEEEEQEELLTKEFASGVDMDTGS